MGTQRVIVVLIACLTLAVFAGGSQSLRRRVPSFSDFDRKSLHGLSEAEGSEVIEKWFDDQMLRIAISKYEYWTATWRQALINELRVSEGQWRMIEPKYERQIQLMSEAGKRATHIRKKGKSSWIKPTEDNIVRPVPKTEAELTEAERSVCRLVDLVRRQDSTDEEVRKEIDALQQARDKARRERPQARRELAAALTTPRQEAVFLLMGDID